MRHVNATYWKHWTSFISRCQSPKDATVPKSTHRNWDFCENSQPQSQRNESIDNDSNFIEIDVIITVMDDGCTSVSDTLICGFGMLKVQEEVPGAGRNAFLFHIFIVPERMLNMSL